MPEEPNAQQQPEAENSTIRQMREQIATLTRDVQAEREARAQAEAKATAFEREKMSELERINAELGDARKQVGELVQLRDEHGRFAGTLEKLYETKLAQVPAEHRDAIQRLSSHGNLADRISALDDALRLVPAAPASFGSPAVPSAGAPPDGPPPKPPVDVKAVLNSGWASVFKPVNSARD